MDTSISLAMAVCVSEVCCPYAFGRATTHIVRYIHILFVLSINVSACDCSDLGSETLVCNKTSGQCPCRPNVALTGDVTDVGDVSDRKCSACVAGAYGFDTG